MKVNLITCGDVIASFTSSTVYLVVGIEDDDYYSNFHMLRVLYVDCKGMPIIVEKFKVFKNLNFSDYRLVKL